MDVFRAGGSDLLVQAILALETEAECRAFLEDLMTGREIRDCTNRLLADNGTESPPGHHHGNRHRGNGRGYQGGRRWAQQE